MPRLTRLSLSLAMFLGALAGAPAASAIVGGSVAATSDSTARVSIAGHACTGSVISPSLVLTAAHCLIDPTSGAPFSLERSSVRTGAVRFTDGQRTPATDLIAHPGYDGVTASYDLGLIQLKEQVPVLPIALARTSDMSLLAPGVTANVFGWGLLTLWSSGDPDADEEPPEPVPPDELHMATLRVAGSAECPDDMFEGFDSTKQLCAQDFDGLAGICPGDSGGPLIARRADGTDVEIGVTSRTALCGGGAAAAFARVDTASPWLADQIAVRISPLPPAPPAPPTPPTPPPTPPQPSPPIKPPRSSATFNGRFVHGGTMTVTLSPDRAQVARIQIGARMTCRNRRHVRMSHTWRRPASSRWVMPKSGSLRIKLNEPSGRDVRRGSLKTEFRRNKKGLKTKFTLVRQARSARLGRCTAGPVAAQLHPVRTH